MKKLYLLPLLAILLLPFVLPSAVADAAESTVRTLTVQGESEFYVTPDEASVEIGITTIGNTAQQAGNNNAAVMQKIQNALMAMGLQKDDIKTSSYNFYPTYDKDNNQLITGYRAENSIVVTTHDINQIGDVIDTAVKNGATNVDSVNFAVNDIKKYKETALKAAVRDAKNKSKAIASELGKSVVNVVSVTEGNVYIENYQPSNIDMKMLSSRMTAATPIQARDLKVSARINISFEIN